MKKVGNIISTIVQRNHFNNKRAIGVNKVLNNL